MEGLEYWIHHWGIYAVFLLSALEGDLTLLLSGGFAKTGFFGEYGLLAVFVAGTLGGMFGDVIAYSIGRAYHEKAAKLRLYQKLNPRISRLTGKFGTSALIFSKYVYGLRSGVCLFYGVTRMPFARFLVLDLISCLIWVIVLAGAGYFFTGAALLFKENKIIAGIILALVVISLYLVERYWLSKRVEEANPETLERIEEKLHEIEDTAQEKLHELGERLHLSKHQEDRKGKAKKDDKDE